MAMDKERYVDIYKQGEGIHREMTPTGVDLEKYYVGDYVDYKTLDDVFVRFIYSAQNYQQMPNVITRWTRFFG